MLVPLAGVPIFPVGGAAVVHAVVGVALALELRVLVEPRARGERLLSEPVRLHYPQGASVAGLTDEDEELALG